MLLHARPSLRTVMLAPAAAALFALTACGGGGNEATGGPPIQDEVGAVTVSSGGDQVSAEPICVGDIPDDLTTCVNSGTIEEIELGPVGQLVIQVPPDVADGGWEVRVNGEPVRDVEMPIHEQSHPVTLDDVSPGEDTILTIESLPSDDQRAAVWQFQLVSEAA